MMISDGASSGRSVRTREAAIAQPDGALQPLVEAIEVSKRYRTQDGTIAALDPVTLVIGEREFTSIVGPSGCGKSTLMRISTYYRNLVE